MTSLRINIGCGHDIRAGYVNVDSVALPGVDIVHDLNGMPLPFETGSVSEVVAKDVLEHIDLVPVMRELHRIMRPGARLWMSSPHFTSSSLWIDPTHRTGFSVETMGFFCRETPFTQWPHYFEFQFERLQSSKLVFHCYRGMPWNYAVERWANRSSRRQRWFEGSALGRLFPASNVEATLIR
jgi:SAM-dependent methyltransferase